LSGESDEKVLLVARLAAQRSHILGALDSLQVEQLRQSVLPSGWAPIGLVQHLALDVERLWFRCALAGDPDAIRTLDEPPEDAWQVPPDVPVDAVLDRYHSEVEAADRAIAAASLEQEPAWWPDYFGTWRLNNLRELLLHVIVETATHAGHLDAARELLDGRQWLVIGG
jgi:uncharacterized damage-inducible protein DinB